MEGEYNDILDWRSSTGSVPPGATTQWGSSIVIAGEAKRIHGLKWKSFMADMYGFATDGELQAIKAYLLSHGNFEIEQVTSQGGGFTTCPFEQSTQSITAFSVILRSLVSSLIWSLVIYAKISFMPKSVFQVEGNGNCLFAAVKKSLQVHHSSPGGDRDEDRNLPYYLNRYFQRQVVHWMADNRAMVMHYMGNALRATYGLEDPTANHEGPMSYVTYLRKMLKKSFWGDEVVLWSISMMWGIKITVVNSKTLQEYRVRHDCSLRNVDVGLVYNGHTHYSAAG